MTEWRQEKYPWPGELRKAEIAFWADPHSVQTVRPTVGEPRMPLTHYVDEERQAKLFNLRKREDEEWTEGIKRCGGKRKEEWKAIRKIRSGAAGYDFLFGELMKTARTKAQQNRLVEAGEALKHVINRAELADTRAYRTQNTRRMCLSPSKAEKLELCVVPFVADLLTEVVGTNFRILAREGNKVERVCHTKKKGGEEVFLIVEHEAGCIRAFNRVIKIGAEYDQSEFNKIESIKVGRSTV